MELCEVTRHDLVRVLSADHPHELPAGQLVHLRGFHRSSCCRSGEELTELNSECRACSVDGYDPDAFLLCMDNCRKLRFLLCACRLGRSWTGTLQRLKHEVATLVISQPIKTCFMFYFLAVNDHDARIYLAVGGISCGVISPASLGLDSSQKSDFAIRHEGFPCKNHITAISWCLRKGYLIVFKYIIVVWLRIPPSPPYKSPHKQRPQRLGLTFCASFVLVRLACRHSSQSLLGTPQTASTRAMNSSAAAGVANTSIGRRKASNAAIKPGRVMGRGGASEAQASA